MVYKNIIVFFSLFLLMVACSGDEVCSGDENSETIRRATSGDVEAQFNLGWMYSEGEGVDIDKRKAAEWYTKAAEQGNADAQFNLGVMYSKGEGVAKDKKIAVEWYTKAAEQGNAYSQFNLGNMYRKGEGVLKDQKQAAEWFRKAAEQGDAKAQGAFAFCYSSGEGVSKDLVLSYAWANLSAVEKTELKKFRDSIKLTPSERVEAERLSSNWKPGQPIRRSAQGPTATNAPASVSKASATIFVVSDSGHALTNAHVVEKCTSISVEGFTGDSKVLSTDSINDLALIQLPGKSFKTAQLSAMPQSLRQGEEIVVFGYPLNSVLSSRGNLTPGVVSALTGLANNTGQIQITAPIQPGSSGSPVINRRGEVVGVVTSKLSDSKMVKATGQVGQNLNFATNGQILKMFLDVNKVTYEAGPPRTQDKSMADIADAARSWTSVITCFQ